MRRFKEVIGTRFKNERSRSHTKKGPGRMPFNKGNPVSKTKEKS